MAGGIAGAMGLGVDYKAPTPQVDQGALGYQTNLVQQGFQKRAQDAQNRKTTMSMDQVREARANAFASRDSQGRALGLSENAALGFAPSVAQMQMQQGMDRAILGGAALANSARGPGQAGAQRTAAYAAGDMQQQTNIASGQLRAEEMARARAEFSQAAMQQRMADLQAQGLDADTAFRQAQIELQSRETNDRYAMGLEGLGVQVGLGELAARTQGQGMNIQGTLGAAGINAGIEQYNAGQNAAMFSGLVGAAAGIGTGGMSMAAGQGMKAAGGGRA